MQTSDSSTPPDHDRLTQLARLAAQRAGGRPPADPAQGWAMVQARLNDTPPDSRPRMSRKTPSVTSSVRPTAAPRRWLYATAATLGAAAIAALVFGLGARDTISHLDHAGQQFATTAGQHANVTLRDGTRVTLAPMSRLTVSTAFGTRERTVTLDGQAYFTVAHVTGAPFQVRTGSVTTQVLGTAFEVRRYAHDPETHVAVTQGKVSVVSSARRYAPVTVTPGTMARVTDSSATVSVTDTERATAWTRGQLDFFETPVSEVLQTVGRWYGLRFEIADSSLAVAKLTARLPYGTRASLLADLQLLLGVTMTFDAHRDSTTVIVRGGSPVPARPRVIRTPLSSSSEVGR